MQTDYIICKLATERCQQNLAQLCALIHLHDEDALVSKNAATRVKDNLLLLIDTLNGDLDSIDDVLGQLSIE